MHRCPVTVGIDVGGICLFLAVLSPSWALLEHPSRCRYSLPEQRLVDLYSRTVMDTSTGTALVP